MEINKIEAGKNLPEEFNVIIEIPSQEGRVKYEFDKKSRAIFVDRFSKTPMHYPCNYGFIPHTLSGDGDPCDVLVMTRYPLIIASVIQARPVGVLLMEDESGKDEKILAVPTSKMDPSFDNIRTMEDIDELFKNQIVHFFENYKDLDHGKWVKLQGWEDVDSAKKLIIEASKRVKNS